MKRESIYYSLHDILTIKTNTEILIPDYFKKEEVKDDFAPDIEISQQDLNFDRPEERKKRSGAFFYWAENKALFIDYEAPLLNAKMIIEDLAGKTKIRFTKAFIKHGNLSQLFETLLSIKLVQKGYAIVHTACLNHHGDALLFTALRDTGKTSTVLSLLDGKDFRFMSDDLTILSKSGEAYSYPRKVNISPYTLSGNIMVPSNDLKSKIKRRMAKSRFEILFGDVLHITMGDRREVPRELIEDKGVVKKIFVIGGGEEEIRKIGNKEVARKILVNTLELYNPFRVYSLNFYYHIFDFNIFDIFDEQRKIVEEAVKDAECFEVRSNNVGRYSEMIREVI